MGEINYKWITFLFMHLIDVLHYTAPAYIGFNLRYLFLLLPLPSLFDCMGFFPALGGEHWINTRVEKAPPAPEFELIIFFPDF